MQIYLARHGQNEDNENGILNGHRDLPLTEFGRQQAREAGKAIQSLGIKFDAILSSPLIRAFETAEIICQISGQLPPIKHEGLIERDFGSMTGKPVSKIKLLCAPDIIETDMITYFLNPEGGETFPDLMNRAKLFLEELKNIYNNNETLLLVAHGDVGKMIYAAYYGLDWKVVLSQFYFGNSEILYLSPDSAPKDAHIIKIQQQNH